jgi:hypothetical protein
MTAERAEPLAREPLNLMRRRGTMISATTYHSKGNLMGKFLQTLAWIATLISFPALAAEFEVVGTYELVSSSTKFLDTGEVVSDQSPKGFIMYGADGRMLVLITYGGRPKPESTAKMTDDERIGLFRTMLAYGGTYSFDGKKMEHHVDICWNEIRCGTTVIRDVVRDGDRLTYTTRPQPSPVTAGRALPRWCGRS